MLKEGKYQYIPNRFTGLSFEDFLSKVEEELEEYNINDEDIIIKEFEHYDQAHNYIDNNFKKIKEGWNYDYYIKKGV